MSRLKLRGKVIVAAVLLVPLIAGAIYLKRPKEQTPGPQYIPAPISRGDIVQAVTTTGQLSPRVSVEVSTQISGLVTQVNVDFNSKVKKGDVLARIDPSTYEQRMHQAEADLAAAQASHRLIESDTKRLKDLREQDLVTQQEYDRAEAQLQQSQAGLLTRRATVENAKLDLDRCTLVSPIDGIVIFKQTEVGKTVAASFSAPTLFVIAQDLSKMRIVAPISEVDIGSVKIGQPVDFTVDAIPGKKFKGELVQIRNPYTPTDNQQQAQAPQQNKIARFDAIIEVDNKDMLLRPSLTANVAVVIARRDQALQIPNSALRVQVPVAPAAAPAATAAAASAPAVKPETAAPAPSATNKNDSATKTVVVYRLPGGSPTATPEPVQIQIGVSDGMTTEVVSGLKQGDIVVAAIAPPPNPMMMGMF